MAQLGRNTKLTIDVSMRQSVRALFEGALRSKVLTPAPDLEVYVLDDEARIGVFYAYYQVPGGPVFRLAPRAA